MQKKLSPKQKAFVAEYLIDHNAAQAAIRAGYSIKGARQTAFKLLTKADIQAALEAKQATIDEKLEITAERTLKEIARVAFSDVRKLFDAKGNLRSLHELDDDTAATLAGVEIIKTTSVDGDDDEVSIEIQTHKIKIADKLSALDKLARHLGLFKEDAADLNVKVTIEGRDADCVGAGNHHRQQVGVQQAAGQHRR